MIKMNKFYNLNKNSPIVLFIDIDGVFHPYGSVALENGRVSAIKPFRWLKQFMETIQDFPDLQLVLHSSWRVAFNRDELQAMIPSELFNKIIAFTDVNIMSRFASIEAYVKEHKIINYVIIDDEGDAFPSGLPELIVANRMEGCSNDDTCAQLWMALKYAHEKNNILI